jgi:hypothetical protein
MVTRGPVCQRAGAMSGRAASAAGQATIEYLAIAAGVVALAAALATVTPSLGERVTGAFACVIDRVGGGACGGQSGAGSAKAAEPVDDGLTERQRAARDLQPGLYDDVPGTAQERIATSAPPPPGGDQCTLSPDKVPGLCDFSYACYAHDLCWQNGSSWRRASARRRRWRTRAVRAEPYTPGRARNCLVALKIRCTSKNAGLRTPSNDTRPFWWIGGCGRGFPPSQSGRTRNSCSAK